MSRWFDPSASGLYIHVPFCTSLCGYCDFYRIESPGGVPEGYVDLLLREVNGYGESPRVPVDTVFFGGGTPSLLSPGDLLKLLDGLREVFEIRAGAEVTLEANPETVSREGLAAWREAGITRLSMGVQSLSRPILAALERHAGPEVARSALALACDAGFEHLSADLMSGVPGQCRQDMERTLEGLADLPLDHLSVYSLDLHPKTRLWDAVVKGELVLPGDEEAADMYLWIHESLVGVGYEHYEVSNFARPGGRCRHNLRYWMGGETIGFGPSAWSRFRGRLWGNPRSLDGWAEAVRKGESAHEAGERLTEKRQREDRVIFGLRVSDGVEEGDIYGLLEEDGRPADAAMRPLFDHGYVISEGGLIKLTTLGFLMSSEILTYLLPGNWPREK